MPIATRGGTSTYWRNWGAGKPSVLMLHCTLAHSGAWQGVAQQLDCTSIAPDLPGHGRSGPLQTGVDYQMQCRDMAAAFLADAPMDIIGHSFGATVALRLALEQPQRVRRLVLVEPVLFAAARGLPGFAEHIAIFEPYAKAMAAGDARLAAKEFTAAWGVGVPWEDMREGQRQVMEQQIHIVTAQDGSVFQDNASVLRPGRLEGLKVPVLLMQGSASPKVIGMVMDVLEQRLHDVRRVTVKGASHMLPITHAGPVAAAINGFLSP